MGERSEGNVKFSRMYDDQRDSDGTDDVGFRAPTSRSPLGRLSLCRGGDSCWPKDAQAKQLALLLVFSAMLVLGLAIALLAVTLTGGSESTAKVPTTAQASTSRGPCTTSDCVTVAAEIIAKMNLSASPCDDFYAYSCGGWMANTFFPPEKAKWSSFSDVYMSNTRLLKKLLESEGNAYGGSPSSSAIRKARDYYAACMNRTAYEDRGAAPLADLIESLGSWSLSGSKWNSTRWDLQGTLVRMHQMDIIPLFLVAVGPDDMNSSVNRIMLQQSGVTLANKDMYNSSNSKVNHAFVQFGVAIVKLLNGGSELVNETAVAERMQAIWNLESKLAAAFVPPEALRDPLSIYHDMSVGEVQKSIGAAINMSNYLTQMLKKDIKDRDRLIVYTPEYFDKLKGVLQEYLADNDKKSVLADYMIWQVVAGLSTYLDEEFRQSRLILTAVTDGVTSLTNRWELCVSRTDNALGFATGALYVSSNFLPDSKQKVEDILVMVRTSFSEGFPSVGWMDPKTRAAAMEKADYIVSKIAYPEWLPNATALDLYYEAVSVTPDNQFANVIESLRFGVTYKLSKLGSVPDRNEWTMAPAEVNAYYNPPYNVIVFPAGILQKPFYDARYPISANLGGVGSVIGHEVTHAFDDQGGLYDKYGNLAKWWENESVIAFGEHTQCMKEQYSGYTVGSENVNGQLTLGENIADNGGIKAAYRALEKWLSNRGGVNSPALLPGLELTHSQLFFIAYAQVWCSYYRPAYAQQALHTDPHSPARYRVIGPLSNSEYFASAFNCPLGSDMNPRRKCSVW